jgi:pimeloyl-ACP methyl ester carboxylesterase
MTDYLLVHEAGQGAWSWGQVWGYLTAPQQHPPRIYTPGNTKKVHALDLPGHGTDAAGDTASVLLEECVSSITKAVTRQDLHDLVLVAHGFAGPLALQAASQLRIPPKRLVLVAGIVPHNFQSMLGVLPFRTKTSFTFLDTLSRIRGREFRIPKRTITHKLCNGINPMEVIHIVGRFAPLPSRVLKSKIQFNRLPPPCPITYIILTKDLILPPRLQKRMADKFPDADIVQLESCHQAMLSQPKELANILLRYA